MDKESSFARQNVWRYRDVYFTFYHLWGQQQCSGRQSLAESTRWEPRSTPWVLELGIQRIRGRLCSKWGRDFGSIGKRLSCFRSGWHWSTAPLSTTTASPGLDVQRDTTYRWAHDRGVDLTMDSITQDIHECETSVLQNSPSTETNTSQPVLIPSEHPFAMQPDSPGNLEAFLPCP